MALSRCNQRLPRRSQKVGNSLHSRLSWRQERSLRLVTIYGHVTRYGHSRNLLEEGHRERTPPLWKSARPPCRWSQGRIANVHLDWVPDCIAFRRKRWFTNSLSQVADELGLAERQKSDLIEYLKSL